MWIKVTSMLAIFATTALTGWAQTETAPAAGGDEEITNEIRDATAGLVSAFNAGKSADVAALFLANGELIDEQGTVYQGPSEVQALLDQFFQTFPGAQIGIEVESTRVVGPVVIQEGIRTTTKDDVVSQVQFTSVLSKTPQGWKIASLRDYPEETLPTPGELLQPLDWLVGDWINEGADARVRINFRWSDDGNFLLGEYVISREGKEVARTSQRIGWDPLQGKPRSWLFDTDGGFSEGTWTPLDDGRWVVRSSAVMPDGTLGSATLTFAPTEPGRFVLAGTSRLVGNTMEDDFELNVVKQPPTAGNK